MRYKPGVGLIRSLVTLCMLALFVWIGATVPLGERTLFGHIGNIWSSEEARELRDGVQEAGGPVVEKVERGVKAGIREATRDPEPVDPPQDP